jgi:predicted amidohydrolase YtcJ
VHAIGDRANGIVLDAFEAALKGSNTNVSALRPRLEHAQIMTEKDTQRLGKLGGDHTFLFFRVSLAEKVMTDLFVWL